MELQLSLGDSPAPMKANVTPVQALTRACEGEDHDLVLRLGVRCMEGAGQDNHRTSRAGEKTVEGEDKEACPEPPVMASFGCPLRQASAQTGSANSEVCIRGFDVIVPVDGRASVARSLSPLSMQMEVPVIQAVNEEVSEDENGGGRVRKKLRLSKEQSVFSEDSFKEHNTLTLDKAEADRGGLQVPEAWQ